ncbi:MAG TPA: hypothetical protein VFS87_01240 [Qipengyuania sp.]|nr:hypothetical protein [Qipengyuania sp.]
MSDRRGKRQSIFERIARRPSHKPAKALSERTEGMPGPSENPETNFIIADVAIRAGSYVARRSLEKGLLAGRYGKDTAHQIVHNKSLKDTLISTVLARIATRSLPGALLVGGGAMAKTLLDRRKSRHRAKAEGDQALFQQARGE